MKKRIPANIVMCAALMTVLLFAAVATSVAWFAMGGASDPVNFTAGSLTGMKLYLGSVTGGEDESARTFSECTDGIVGITSPTENGGAYSIALSDMSFGVIDNLAKLKAENIVYLRFDIPKTSETDIRLTLSDIKDENNYFFDIYKNNYDANGNAVSQVKLDPSAADDKAILDGVRDFQTAESGYLSYTYAFSAERYDGAIPETLRFSEDVTFFSSGTDVSVSCPEDVLSSVGESGMYHLYVRIVPDFNTFAYSIEYLTPIMPCYMLFHINVEFEMIPKEAE